MRRNGYRTLLMAALVFACFLWVPAYGAARKQIGSVTIYVKSRVRAGDSLSRNDLVEGEPADGEIGVWVNSEQYALESARITAGKARDLSVGREIQIRTVLEPLDDERTFKRGFGKDDVRLRGSDAEVTSVSRSSGRLSVTLRLSGVRGVFEAPEDVRWKQGAIGLGSWTEADGGSGYYELILKRGERVIKRVRDYAGTSYDFYPYMTRAGQYRFMVRTVAHTEEEQRSGKQSKWEESEAYSLAQAQVSDGSGAIWDSTSEGEEEMLKTGAVGWINQNGTWYYRFPDQSWKKNGWESVLGAWYYFDANGKMQTGWVKTASGWYYLGPSGAMLTGWQNVNERWYYLKEDASAADYGVMAENRFLTQGDSTWFVNSLGQRAAGWTEVNGAWFYFDENSGKMARKTVIGTCFVDENGIWRK